MFRLLRIHENNNKTSYWQTNDLHKLQELGKLSIFGKLVRGSLNRISIKEFERYKYEKFANNRSGNSCHQACVMKANFSENLQQQVSHDIYTDYQKWHVLLVYSVHSSFIYANEAKSKNDFSKNSPIISSSDSFYFIAISLYYIFLYYHVFPI